MRVSLHAKQSLAFVSPATELLYGGAAGGGKSHLLRVSAIRWCLEVPGIQCYLFRKSHPDLRANHLRGAGGLPALLATATGRGLVKWHDQAREFRFDNGAILKLAHLQHEGDLDKYQGADIHVLLMDELTHFSAHQYRFLRARVRLGGLQVPDRYAALLPRIECATNPGSIGHAWVKRSWIEPAPPFQIHTAPTDDGGMQRQYIPARLADNPTLAERDPGYLARLEGLSHPALVKAMRDGDWDIVAGQALEMWSGERHVIRPFAIPRHWLRFRSIDWGSSKPFSIGWWAVADGNDGPLNKDGIPHILAAGTLVRYREWYGWNGAPDQGLRITARQVASGLLERQQEGEKIVYTVADRAMFNRNDGPSVAEHFARAGVPLRPSDSARKAGFQEVRARLIGTDGAPGLVVFDTCRDGAIRTLPNLVLDRDDPEDVDTRTEDHTYDELRYACMSRPWVQRSPRRSSAGDRWQQAFAPRPSAHWRTH